MRKQNEPKAMIDPTIVARRNGAVVNDVIPSKARFNKLMKFHLLTPDLRSPRSNVISFLLKPIQQNSPLL